MRRWRSGIPLSPLTESKALREPLWERGTRDARQVFMSTSGLFDQKGVADGPGDFLWSLFVDPEMIAFWEDVRF